VWNCRGEFRQLRPGRGDRAGIRPGRRRYGTRARSSRKTLSLRRRSKGGQQAHLPPGMYRRAPIHRDVQRSIQQDVTDLSIVGAGMNFAFRRVYKKPSSLFRSPRRQLGSLLQLVYPGMGINLIRSTGELRETCIPTPVVRTGRLQLLGPAGRASRCHRGDWNILPVAISEWSFALSTNRMCRIRLFTESLVWKTGSGIICLSPIQTQTSHG